ncbi:MAG: ATP-dependent DNA helicase RecG [Thermodesulfobacteriota bacterium]
MQRRKKNIPGILAPLKKPLELASRDGYSRIDSIKGLEAMVERVCSEALSVNPAEALLSRLEDLRAAFRGFDSLAGTEKRASVMMAREIINSLNRGGIQDRNEDEESLSAAEAKARLSDLNTSVKYVKGVGPKLGERFEKKGLKTVQDLLYFLPLRYEDRSNIKKIRELIPGASESTEAEVMVAGETRYGRRKGFEIVVSDGTGFLKLKWFNYRLPYMKRYQPGSRLIVFGSVSRFGPNLEMIHPDIEVAGKVGEERGESKDFGAVVPVYSQIDNLHQKTLRKIIQGAVDRYAGSAVGGVPEEVLERHGLMPLSKAIREVHFPEKPPSANAKTLAERSLAFDELFILEAGLALKKTSIKKEQGLRTFSGASSRALEEKLREMLPFRLTAAQENVLAALKGDMKEPHPMNRLIQGDVGSGKTVVALTASLWAVGSGFQAAIMAPTEILSEQHYLTIHKYTEALGVKTILLTGRMGAKARREALAMIGEGMAHIVVGTHALIQGGVEFKDLGLVIVDEQHRFGVVQRSELKKKGRLPESGERASPDTLIMTATPIPRTLSMTVFGELDVSVIDELPPGRRPVETKILREKDRGAAYDIIRKEVASGAQAYVVYPLVEESEELSLRDATNMKEHLERDVFADLRLALLHGRMKSLEKEAVMRAFKNKSIDILVSTTVIEVGVDVPNASVILIEHAERFGLAQLHQLRGRVGRGGRQSHCLLLAQWTNSPETYKRLKVMEATEDGFRIAEEDLNIRGPGDFVGARQSGLPDFRFSWAMADMRLLESARREAIDFIEKNPLLSGPGAGAVKAVLNDRWAGRLGLAEVG